MLETVTRFVCDRCRKSDVPEMRTFSIPFEQLHLDNRQADAYRVADLCPDCYAYFLRRVSEEMTFELGSKMVDFTKGEIAWREEVI